MIFPRFSNTGGENIFPSLLYILIRILIKQYLSAYLNKPINITLYLLDFIVKMIYQKVPIYWEKSRFYLPEHIP